MIISVNEARKLVKLNKLVQLEKDVSLVIESAAKDGCSSCVVVIEPHNCKEMLKRLLNIGYIAYTSDYDEIYISWEEN